MNTVERIEALTREKNMNISQLERELNFSHSSIRNWETRQPTASRLLAVADYFDVSVDYLLCRTDDRHKFVASPDDNILQLQRAMSKMTVSDKKRMMNILKAGFEYAFEDETSTDKK